MLVGVQEEATGIATISLPTSSWFSRTPEPNDSGTVIDAAARATLPERVRLDGGNVLSRRSRQFSEEFNLALQVCYDRTFRSFEAISEERNTIEIDRYTELQIRLGWRPRKNVELSIVGSNLPDAQYPERVPTTINTGQAEIERCVFGKIIWRF